MSLTTVSACRDSSKVVSVEASGSFEPHALSFGRVPVGTLSWQEVTIFNRGKVPFRTTQWLSNWKVPQFRVETEDVFVPPFSSRRVRLGFLPTEERTYSDFLNISADSLPNPAATVFLEGQGAPSPLALAPSVLEFQTLEIDSTRTLEVTVTNPTLLPVSFDITGSHAKNFSVSSATAEPQTSQKIGVTFQPMSLGKASAQLNVRACASCTAVSISLEGNCVESAFVFTPSPVYFKDIPVHETTRSSTTARNITWRGVNVSQLLSQAPFTVTRGPSRRFIGPGQTFETEVEYGAQFSGKALGTLTVEYLSDKTRSSSVSLDAQGGRPQIAVTPASIDFGEWPVGSKTVQTLRISNAGIRGVLNFLGIEASGQTPFFSVSSPLRKQTPIPYQPGSTWPKLPSAPIPIAPGDDFLEVQVFFEPLSEGSFQAQLVILSDDIFTPKRSVTLRATARPSGPCQFRLSPTTLDFGNVPPGQGAVLGFYFQNLGRTECAVKDIRLTKDAGGVFFMPGGEIVGDSVPRLSSFSAQVAFSSNVEGIFEGELSITVNSPTTPVARLPLKAMARESCLVATPSYLDFGPVRYDCAPPLRRTVVRNDCPFPVDIVNIEIGEGTSDQFSLEEAPAVPLFLAPAEGMELVASYSRNVHGQHFSPLYIDSPQEAAPFLIPLLGETNHEGFITDTFVQGNQDELDVLLIISNTSTMSRYQARLQADLPRWFATAQANGVSLQVGVTTTGLVERSAACPGGAFGGEAGRLFPADGQRPRVVEVNDAQALTTLRDNIEVGTCHNLVQGLETLRAALSPPLIDQADDARTPLPDDGNEGFLRATARLAAIFVVDEEDHSGFSLESYVEFFRGLKGPSMAHRVSAHAIVPIDDRCQTAGQAPTRFEAMAQQTRGSVMSICEASYAPLLQALTRQAAQLDATFVLSAEPAVPAAIEVYVQNTRLPPEAFDYKPLTKELTFRRTSTPPAGSVVEVRYQARCP